MAYAYYQQQYPGWGTSQFQLGPPPVPSFQPEPAWSGWDYYRAHAVNPNPSLFYSILDRVRGYDGSQYVSTHDARSIHRRLYGGLMSLSQVMPAEIGSAAAYEAYRTWKYHGSLLQPLGGQAEREREALMGLASAEASHLWQYSGRPMDTYGLQDALQSAALTASRLYSRRTNNIIQDTSNMATVGTSAPIYARDYGYTHSRRSSVPSVIRGSSASPYVGGGSIPPGPASLGGTPQALSGSVGLPLTGGIPLSTGYNTPLGGTPYAGANMPLPSVQSGGMYSGATLQPNVSMPQPQVGMSYPMQSGYANSAQRPIVIQQAQPTYGGYSTGYTAGGYGGYGAYGGYGGYSSGMYGSGNRPIVIDASGRSRRHHYRSRSTEPFFRSRHGYRHGYF